MLLSEDHLKTQNQFLTMAKLSLFCAILLLSLSAVDAESHDGIPEQQKQDFPSSEKRLLRGGSQGQNEGAENKHARLRRSDDLGSVEAVLAAQAQKLTQLEAQLQAAENRLQASESKAKALETDFQATKIKLAHAEGVAGGKYKGEKGSGTNRLCLSMSPEFDHTAVPSSPARLFGAEYYEVAGHHNDDVVCSVCRANFSTTIMVPGTLTCPKGWVSQYTGHLMATYYDNNYASEYVCLDGKPEDRQGSSDERYSNYFIYTVTYCGSLPCPPYIHNKVVTCVVCSN